MDREMPGKKGGLRINPFRLHLGGALIIVALVLPIRLHAQPSTGAVPSAGVAPSTSPSLSIGNTVAPPPKSLQQSFIEGMPSIAATLTGVLLSAILAWVGGLRLAAVWDVRKKRTEIDLLLTQELNKVIAEFKAIGRDREALKEVEEGAAKAATAAASAMDTTLLEEIRKSRLGLISRAITAESNLEAILLKMLGDMETALLKLYPKEVQKERARQIRVMGLTRVAFRRVREMLVDGSLTSPGYGEAPTWLFNRLAADLTSIVVARATLPPPFRGLQIRGLQSGANAAPTATESYLKVIAYRTVDLQMAEATMQVATQAYRTKRDAARGAAWLKNVRKVFPANKIVVFERSRDGTWNTNDDNPNRPIIVDVADRGTNEEVEAAADLSFAGRPALRWYVALIAGGTADGGGARMLAKSISGPLQVLRENDPLPKELLREAGILQTGAITLILLGWHQATAAAESITAMAAVELGNQN